MLKIFKCRILENKKIGPECFRMTFTAPQIARESKAGQFVHIRCFKSPVLFLRRPFSIHGVHKDRTEILYRIVGKGTKEIAGRKPGEFVDVIGPLGQGFEISRELKFTILVAGGIGVAPLVMLAEDLKKCKAGTHKAGRVNCNVTVLIGAKTKKELLCKEEFEKLGCEVKVSTEDGSEGSKGLVTDLLKRFLPSAISKKPDDLWLGWSTIYACGPKEMLKKVTQIAERYNIPTEVSLEENMACGIGACYGCPVKTKQGYKLVCKDGPVFKANEIVWE